MLNIVRFDSNPGFDVLPFLLSSAVISTISEIVSINLTALFKTFALFEVFSAI